MANKTIVKTYSDTVQVMSYEPCSVRSVSGTWAGTADGYIQLFDQKSATLTEASVPVWEGKVFASAPFDYPMQTPLKFERGCVAAFSTTPAVYGVTAETGDIFVMGEGLETVAITTESETDNASSHGVTGAKRLKRIDLVQPNANGYIQLFDSATLPADGTYPIWVEPITLNATHVFLFGEGLVIANPLVSTSDTGKTLTSSATAIVLIRLTYTT